MIDQENEIKNFSVWKRINFFGVKKMIELTNEENFERVSYKHPKFNQIKNEVEKRFSSDFQNINMEVVEAYCEKENTSIMEKIIIPKMEMEVDEEWFPMWGTLFECADKSLERWVLANIEKLADEGIGVIEGIGHLNSLLFIMGAGYDFFEAHWIPLYVQIFGWVDPKDYEGEGK